MKKIAFLLILFSMFHVGRAQDNNIFSFPIDTSSGKISFEKVYELPGVSKDEIYARIKIWIAEIYNSSTSVINMDDKEAGIIKVKGVNVKNKVENGLKFNQYTHYDLCLYVKDYKYKGVLDNLGFQTDVSGNLDHITPLEMPMFFTKDSEQMKYYEYRKNWGDEIKAMVDGLFTSLSRQMKGKSKMDF
jgi:hypothetical protein